MIIIKRRAASAVVAIAILSFCGTAFPKDNPLPGDSFANFSKPVRKDILKNLKQYFRMKFECKKFDVVMTESFETDSKVLVDKKKRLKGGFISEKWTVQHCGETVEYKIVVSPDGNGGTYVAIAAPQDDT